MSPKASPKPKKVEKEPPPDERDSTPIGPPAKEVLRLRKVVAAPNGVLSAYVQDRKSGAVHVLKAFDRIGEFILTEMDLAAQSANFANAGDGMKSEMLLSEPSP